MVPERMTAARRVPRPIMTRRPKVSCSAAATPPGQVVGERVWPVADLAGKSVRVAAPWQAMRKPMTIRQRDRPIGGSDLTSGMWVPYFRLDPPGVGGCLGPAGGRSHTDAA